MEPWYDWTANYQGTGSKYADNMCTRFEEDSKFSGKLYEHFSEFIRNYTDACNDYRFSVPKRYRYLYHLFSCESQIIYRDE